MLAAARPVLVGVGSEGFCTKERVKDGLLFDSIIGHTVEVSQSCSGEKLFATSAYCYCWFPESVESIIGRESSNSILILTYPPLGNH